MPEHKPIIHELNAGLPCILHVLRLDLMNGELGGNKWFKLKYNLQKAIEEKKDSIVTFGGAFSNHIAASAAAAKQVGLKSVGIIRGNSTEALNTTLRQAVKNGMELCFVSRETYRIKNELAFLAQINDRFDNCYIIPEGGCNAEGVLGCVEIIKSISGYDYICCACGTGTTYAGLAASGGTAKIVGLSVLKGKNTLPQQAVKLLRALKKEIHIGGNEELERPVIDANTISNNYCFSGYAAYNKQLVEFKEEFEEKYNIPLDYIYTAKLFFAVFDLVKNKKIKEGSSVLLIHSGGLQGNVGFEERYHLTPKR